MTTASYIFFSLAGLAAMYLLIKSQYHFKAKKLQLKPSENFDASEVYAVILKAIASCNVHEQIDGISDMIISFETFCNANSVPDKDRMVLDLWQAHDAKSDLLKMDMLNEIDQPGVYEAWAGKV